MKKITAITTAAIIALSSFSVLAQDAAKPAATPELLQKKELYKDEALFDLAAIYTDAEKNLKAIADYEANKASYTPDMLFPVSMLYITTGNAPRGVEILDEYLAAVPTSTRAMNMKGYIGLLNGKTQEAIDLYRKSFELGDKDILKRLCFALAMANKIVEVKPYIAELKELSKKDLDAATIILAYALHDAQNHDDVLIKETLENLDPKEALKTSTPNALDTMLKVYAIKKDLFPARLLVIPAKGAANAYLWIPAKEAYDAALKADPKDTLALRGKALVEYRTGDIQKAAKLLKEAASLGDVEAVSDASELYILSGSDSVWKEFGADFASYELKPAIRVAMFQIGERKDLADAFFAGVLGKNSEVLYRDEAVKNRIASALEKFSKDPRAAEVKALIEANKK